MPRPSETALPTQSANTHEAKPDFRVVFETTPAPYLVLLPDEKFTIISVNNAYLRATHTQREIIIGKGLFEVFPDNLDGEEATGTKNLRASLMRVLKDSMPDTMPIQKYDIPKTAAEGGGVELRFWSPVNTPVLNAEGTVDYIIHSVEDVTEFMLLKQKELTQEERAQTLQVRTEQLQAEVYRHIKELVAAQEAVNLSNERYRILTSILPVGVFHTDREGNCLYTNPPWQKITGIEINQIEDKRWFNLVHPVDRQQALEMWEKCLARSPGQEEDKSTHKIECRFLLPNNQENWVLLQIAPEVNTAGQLQRLVGSVTDITEHKRLEEEQKKRTEALAEIDRAKTVFFSNVSHEFITPLTLIQGPLEESLADDAGCVLSPSQLERIIGVHRNALRLLRLVNSLLDLSRLEAGRMKGSYEPTDLAQLTIELVGVFSVAIEKAGLKLNVDVASVGEPVYVDKDMWEKIVFNLLSNALKYTLKGSITISLVREEKCVALSVTDTGCGISMSQLPRIFERFYRAHEMHGRTYEGAGVGLALTQELAKLHGGKVGVTSQLGKGSTFTVYIPLGKAHLPADQIKEMAFPIERQKATGAAFLEEALRWLPEPEEQSVLLEASQRIKNTPQPAPVTSPSTLLKPAISKRKILVADDNAELRAYLKRLLSPHFEICFVNDGEAALNAAREEEFDLVLSDIMMPKMDGLQLAQALQSEAKTEFIPIILLSPKAREETRVEGLQLGVVDYLVKPFSANELIARINTHLELSSLRKNLEEKVRERTQKLQQSNLNLQQKIIELNQAETALIKSERYFRTVISMLPICIARFDKVGNIIFANKRSCELLQLNEEELKGENWRNTIHPEDKERVWDLWQKMVAEKRDYFFTNEFRYMRKDKTCIWVVGEVMAEKDERGECISYFGTLTDITNLKTLEEMRLAAVQQASEQQRQRAEEAEKYQKRQEQFVDTMCHELRNPLNGIYGNISLLKTSLAALEELIEATESVKLDIGLRHQILSHITENKLSIQSIDACAQHQKAITDDVLTLSKLDSGKVNLTLTDFDPRKVIQDVLQMLESEVIRKQVQLYTKLPHNNMRVNSDCKCLTQVLLNLVGNAIKFTPEAGTITISLLQGEATENDIMLQFIVEDTGIGMTEEEKAKVFDRFEQANHATHAEYGGSGLGLTISKNLVELMGGKIEVESKKGFGTRFTFTIKCKNVPILSKAPPQPLSLFGSTALAAPAKRHILVVEDNLINQKVLKKILQQAGHRCEIANNGKEACEMAKKTAYDIILMDIEMPIMNGLEATQIIRQQEEEEKTTHVPIIGLSGNAREEHIGQAKCVGMTDYITKPYEKTKLLDKIVSYTAVASTSPINVTIASHV